MPIVCVRIAAFPEDDAARWDDVLDALDAASPVVEDAGPGLAFLEMAGIEGGAGGWLDAVRGALAGFDLPLRVGLGPNPFVAQAAAALGEGTICEGDPAAFLAPFPLEQLGCGEAVCGRLRLLGIGTLGELAALPHGPFVRRFGPPAGRWHEHARGIDRSARTGIQLRFRLPGRHDNFHYGAREPVPGQARCERVVLIRGCLDY